MVSPIGAKSVNGPIQSAQERPLRIGLNLIFLEPRLGGTGRYAMELPNALIRAEPETEVHVFVSRDAPRHLLAEPCASRVRWTTLPIRMSGPPIHALAQFAGLPALARARGLDVLHSRYDGSSLSRPMLIERSDGTLARRLDFPAAPTAQVKRCATVPTSAACDIAS